MSHSRSSYTTLVDIHVPRDTKWNPEVAQTLLVSWFELQEFLRLLIRATSSGITWHVEVPHHQTDALVQVLRSHYAKAEILVRDKKELALGFYLYEFHGTKPYIFPIRSASDFNQLDPIASLISGLGTLENDEVIIYELSLASVRQEMLELGYKLVGELMPALPSQVVETNHLLNSRKKLTEAKQLSPLKEASLSLKVKASSPKRADELIKILLPALAIYELEGFNMLTWVYEGSYSLVLSPGEVAGLWHLPTEYCQEPRVVWSTSVSAPAPPNVTKNLTGILLGTNHFQGKSQEVWLPDSSRATHINVIGRTGTGKTTLLHQMIHQDIQAGKGVGVIDPHGDLIEAILQSSIPTNREADLIVFDINDHTCPIGLNLLKAPENLETDLIASYALDVIRKMFADDWSATRMETALYAALGALVSAKNTSLWDVPRMFHNSDFRMQILEQVTDSHILDYWYGQFEPVGESMQRQIADPINHRLSKFYRNQAIRRVVCQPSSLDFRSILDTQKIFLVKLGTVMDIDMETLGALIISKFELAAMSRGEIPPDSREGYYLYIDEVHNFITTSLSKMFSQARKFGLRLVVANQYLRQLETDVLDAILGNVGASIVFRTNADDARTLGPFFEPQFSADQVANLDKYQAVVKMQYGSETQPAFDIRTLSPLADKSTPARLARADYLRQMSHEKYGRPSKDVDDELRRWTEKWRPARTASKQGSNQEGYFG